ncbi:MAG: GNAT family N-acetyltransferase [Acidobacteria bacterium]|nr:GNAT family N-acetyltransferase [Acidobacteriota bacterium]
MATIRLARATDAPAIARLTAQLGYDVPPSEVAARLARILAKHDHRFFVAERDGRPAGWLHAVVAEYVETGPFVNIAGLVVDRAYRGTGIGRLLMQHAEAWAGDRGCPVVRLWSSVGRTAAHRFYEHLGYTSIKTQYAFARAVDPGTPTDLATFAPHIRE